ncbi:hypothetical protein AUT26_16625 [[Arthrobacter] sp. ATCC 21022]|nr:hypothetical protein AUT26_16625 [Arthrobacter sp. ATCC 21022]KUR64487.1 hypothetical protein JM67_10680 [Arthrobacter sp. ATCC 21022]
MNHDHVAGWGLFQFALKFGLVGGGSGLLEGNTQVKRWTANGPHHLDDDESEFEDICKLIKPRILNFLVNPPDDSLKSRGVHARCHQRVLRIFAGVVGRDVWTDVGTTERFAQSVRGYERCRDTWLSAGI